MSSTDVYIYDLIHCSDPTKDLVNQATSVTPSPYDGLVVYIDGMPQADTYIVTNVGLNGAMFYTWMPPVSVTNLTSCADPNADKIYRVIKCGDPKVERFVLLTSAQAVGSTVLRFLGECTCWEVVELVSTYTEILTIASSWSSCTDCFSDVVSENCSYEERTIGYAVKVGLPKPEPPDRGFDDCCESSMVLADLSDTASYKNDFTSVYFQKQTATDTVTYEIEDVNTAVITPLVDVTHGVLYDFDIAHNNPNLSYFKVEWRKILSVLGSGSYIIRKKVTIAGVGPTGVNSPANYELKPFSISRANNTVRIDCKMDGTMEKININFKQSGYESSLRVPGYFGDAQEDAEQDNVVFGNKKGVSYYESQITMRNNPDYVFQASDIPECISRDLRKFLIFANEIFISDYNTNNHSYEYEVYPVILSEISNNSYPVEGRGVSMEMTFKDRSRGNIKTNCN